MSFIYEQHKDSNGAAVPALTSGPGGGVILTSGNVDATDYNTIRHRNEIFKFSRNKTTWIDINFKLEKTRDDSLDPNPVDAEFYFALSSDGVDQAPMEAFTFRSTYYDREIKTPDGTTGGDPFSQNWDVREWDRTAFWTEQPSIDDGEYHKYQIRIDPEPDGAVSSGSVNAYEYRIWVFLDGTMMGKESNVLISDDGTFLSPEIGVTSKETKITVRELTVAQTEDDEED